MPLYDIDSSKSNVDLRNVSHEQLVELLEGLGYPKFRAKQVEDWVWKHHVTDFQDMTNVPAKLRADLAERCALGGTVEVARQISNDGSRKYLLGYDDGTQAECVGMPNRNRLAVCVSTQAGCRMGCVFCATGQGGFSRSLKATEIYDQVMHVSEDFQTRASSVVMMGQGEPFNNYDEVLKALRMLNSPEGAGIGARHLTVSTCGIIPMIRRFAKEPEQFTLAVSLHSAVQATRNTIMPGVKKYTLARLHDAMAEYVEATGRRPTYEYALIGGVNDNNLELDALCDFTRGTLAHVNLIQLNDLEGSKLKPSTAERAEQFVRRLAQVGVEATIRNSRGNDIDAACGQLSQKHRVE
ncbi:23S rRNA (adenine(2503)-C(2))-methyltransferase RlmN [uncultured Parolsenella sp.]|uniref:23S rRNA (adenine(2503)-C(2))-methyltransferase RlmN n=1 Tax=uncultured Parolsenella sp. TaxID=2083008 RepID=UPI0025CFC448|nr:23S rRNA (adenine(2503)-C(2))-methyltransferase RlmN [uncultured Parolsenella sp.]